MANVPLSLGQMFLLIGIVGLPVLAYSEESTGRPDWKVGDSWSYSQIFYPTARVTTIGNAKYTLVVTAAAEQSYALAYSATDIEGKPESGRQIWSIDTNYMNRQGEGGKSQEFRWYNWPLVELARENETGV